MVGEWLSIAVLAVLGVVLGAWYMLWLVQRTFFGPLREPHHDQGEPPVRDLSLREFWALAPLVVFIFWIGLTPQFFLERMRPQLEPLATELRGAFDRQYWPEVEATVSIPGERHGVAALNGRLAPKDAAVTGGAARVAQSTLDQDEPAGLDVREAVPRTVAAKVPVAAAQELNLPEGRAEDVD